MDKKKEDSFLEKEEITIRSDVDSKDIFHSTPIYAGDSVDEHKQLEEVNEMREFDTYKLKKHVKALIWLYFFVKFFSFFFRNIS